MIDGLLSPASAFLLALAAPILAVYMLRSRRPPVEVSSTFLWERELRNVTATKPWQRLRPSVLLFLQLLALAALVLAATGPFRTAPGISGDHLVLVVDASGSMLARSADTTRMDEARREAHALLDRLGPTVPVSLIEAGGVPDVKVSNSTDRRETRRAIDSLEAGEAPGDLAESFLLAESLETPNLAASIFFISDGGLTETEQALVPPGAEHVVVGSEEIDNLSVRLLTTLEQPDGSVIVSEVRNHGERERRTELTVEIDGVPQTARSIAVPPGDTVEVRSSVDLQDGKVTVRISGDDDLAEDNVRYAILEQTRPRKILLVGPGNLFLEVLLSRIPGASLDTAEEPSSTDPYDLIVYDRVEVTEPPDAPALYVATPGAPGVDVRGTIDLPLINFIAADDPLLESVDLSELAIAQALAVDIPGGHTLVGSKETPLLATYSEGLLRRAWIGFDLHESNFPVTVAFPIYADHVLRWLTGSDRDPDGEVGQTLPIVPPAGTVEAELTYPDGRTAAVAPEEAASASHLPGFYDVTFHGDQGPLAETSVAMSFPTQEQALEVSQLEVESLPGRQLQPRPGVSSVGPFVLILGLMLLLGEWWWAHGRPLPGARAA